MFKSQKGIATVLGLLLVALMVGGMAVTIEIVRNPTDFSSSASNAFNQINVFNTKGQAETPPKLVSSPSSKSQATGSENKFSVQIIKGPYSIVTDSQCFDVSASSTSCLPLSVNYSFDHDQPSTQAMDKTNECSFLGTVCAQRSAGDHKLTVKVIDENSSESDETVLNYQMP